MKSKLIIVPAVVIFFFASFKPVQDELFYGESKFASCKITLPLNDTRRSEKELAEKAKELKDKQIILLHVNPNTGDISYGRYFLVSDVDVKTKKASNYLVRADDYKAGKFIATYPKYSEKNDRFYLGNCFDEVLKNNPDIQQKLIEEGRLP